MEALTAIDVNTGRFVGKSSLEDTITKTNLEACREVAEQLRIRSIGGMIVVDFIDMDRPQNRERVTRAFNDYLRRDRSKAAVTRISELGLVEMTRKRTRESLLHTLTEPCTACEGKGYTKSRRTVAYEVLRELRRQGDLIETDSIVIEVHPDVAQVLATTDHAFLEDLEKRLQKRLVVKARGSFQMEDFEIHPPGEKAIEKSEVAAGRDREEPKRKRKRKQALGSPADVEAMLAETEAEEAEAAAGAGTEGDPDVDIEAAGAVVEAAGAVPVGGLPSREHPATLARDVADHPGPAEPVAPAPGSSSDQATAAAAPAGPVPPAANGNLS
jgi:ribonuclease G